MLKIIKKAAALAVSAAMVFTLSSCDKEKLTGNIDDVVREDNDTYAIIKIMDYGEITAKLFPAAAPESVKRFIEFAERGYYDGRTIHRVIDDYLIQGGSLNGDGSDGEVPDNQYIPVETSEVTYNFYGALCFAAAKKGSYAQFYIVDKHTPQDIDAVIEKLTAQLADEAITSRLLDKDKKQYEDYLAKLKAIPEQAKEKYKKVGGLYELDGKNTVFGQVIGGLDVLEAISATEVVTGNKIDDQVGTPSKPIDSIVIETIEIVRVEPEETTTETEETKKTKKTKETEKINAETLPPLEDSSSDTTQPAEEASSDNDAVEVTPEPSPAPESADTEPYEEAVIAPETEDIVFSEEPSEQPPQETQTPETLNGDDVVPEDGGNIDDSSVEVEADTGEVTQSADAGTAASSGSESLDEDDEVVIIEE